MYSIALSENIGKFATMTEFMTLDEDTLVAAAAKVMRDKNTTCILIVSKDSKGPIGIVTERDMLYRVLAENLGPYKVTLKKIMSTPLITGTVAKIIMSTTNIMPCIIVLVTNLF